MIHTTTAIVLRPTPFQEGAVVVSFLTEHGEKITGIAKGAKKPSAKWVSSFEPLGLVQVGFFGREQSETQRITRCELQHSPLILGHLESNLVVACLADLFDRVAKPGMEDDRLFRLLSSCSRAIKQEPDGAMRVLAYAEHWLLHCLGLLPHPRLCNRCGDDTSPLVALRDDFGWCCARCTPCEPEDAFPSGAREHLRLLRSSGAEAAPGPDGTPAAHAVTERLRHKLLKELGGKLSSYEVLFMILKHAKARGFSTE